MRCRFVLAALAALLVTPAALAARPGPRGRYRHLRHAARRRRRAHEAGARAPVGGLMSRVASRAVVGPDGRLRHRHPVHRAPRARVHGRGPQLHDVPLVVDRPRRPSHSTCGSSTTTTPTASRGHGHRRLEPLRLRRRRSRSCSQPDGRYSLEVDGDRRHGGLPADGRHEEPSGHSINGTQAGRYEYDNGGDYRSRHRGARRARDDRLRSGRPESHAGARTSVAFRDGTTRSRAPGG